MEEKSIVLGIGFTNACNMNCEFCYSKNNRLYSYRQPVDVWKAFFRRNGKFLKSVNYGTGENVLEDDWFELIEFIADEFPHIVQAVTTNGSLAHELSKNSKRESIFLKAIREVDVSLDYADKEHHNNIRKNPYAYDWAIETMQYCKEHKRRLTVVTIGLNDTLQIDNIEGIFRIAYKYGALNRINIYRKNAMIEDDCELDYDVLMTFLEWVSLNHQIIELSDPLFNAVFGGRDIVDDASGRNSFRIVSDGRIFPSTYLLTDKFLMGTICDSDFSFDNPVVKKFIENIAIPESCMNCELRDKCKGGAIDRRYLWYRSFSQSDPYCPNRHPYSREYKVAFPENYEECESVHKGYLPTLFFKF